MALKMHEAHMLVATASPTAMARLATFCEAEGLYLSVPSGYDNDVSQDNWDYHNALMVALIKARTLDEPAVAALCTWDVWRDQIEDTTRALDRAREAGDMAQLRRELSGGCPQLLDDLTYALARSETLCPAHNEFRELFKPMLARFAASLDLVLDSDPSLLSSSAALVMASPPP